MKKYSVMARVRMADRTSTEVVTFKALSVADALARFERYHQSDMTFDDVEVTAVYQCSACTCRTQGGGRWMMETVVCPHARGFIPQELTCRLNVRRDAKLPWWKRLWRSFRGDYCCPTEGTLPCPVMAAYNEARKEEGK